MATQADLISRVRKHLLDPAGERYSDPTILSALSSEARALFASEDVPSDMIGAVLTEAPATEVDELGRFAVPTDSLRICVAYIGPTRVTNVIMRKGLGSPIDHNSLATIADPAIFAEGGKTYLLPPKAFEGKNIEVLYVKETVDLEDIPPAFEDVICLNAAAFAAGDVQETKTSAILRERAAVHLARVLGAKK